MWTIVGESVLDSASPQMALNSVTEGLSQGTEGPVCGLAFRLVGPGAASRVST